MDIVDAQIHVGPEGFEPALAEMHAVGVRGALIDEYWSGPAPGESGGHQPGYPLPGGAWRCTSPIAERASLEHPERFSYLLRVDRRDPELESLLAVLGSAPSARAIRILPVWTDAEAAAFVEGAYQRLFELAQRYRLPVFVFIPGRVELLAPYLERFPELTCFVDHCGMPFGPPGSADVGYFDRVLELAAYPNAALKWSHAQARFEVREYPYRGLWPHLHRALEAFGAERVVWASDKSVIPDQSWAELLYWIRDASELGRSEKEWILGRSLRRLLDWPEATSEV